MSFKREGNDKGLLNKLRRRRVTELLGEDIPEDEAKLLCNGRLACLVCTNYPVFDTVDMLMVHRNGRRHARNIERFLRLKKEVQALIDKRKHEQFMKDGTTVITQGAATSSGIKPVHPYDPRVKKHKLKPYDRKPCLDLHSDPLCSQPQSSVSNVVSDSPAFSMDVPQRHSHQLKNIFQPSLRNQGPVTPYVRQRGTFTDSSSTSNQPVHSLLSSDSNLSQTSAVVDPPHSVSISSTTSPSSSSSHCGFATPPAASRGLYSCSSSSVPLGATTATPVKLKCPNKRAVSAGVSEQVSGNLCTVDNKSRVEEKGRAGGLSVSHPAESVGDPAADVPESAGAAAAIAEKNRLAQKYYQLSGSGWKKDWDGKWIRDGEAEFDSDEEPPDLP